ncbi:hypothetical protein FIBSPDRAFT_864106 [Athelia psychrophila]|uniref:Uncharacterized protein n=1 Tax=Athelia psychrophila TaxID=1759441 RepID=A0A166GU68_9AGAM|nr:hypothetical protein FIBSPDRAFT_864106 [Fibularhizoctonia sp. CBS 109695]
MWGYGCHGRGSKVCGGAILWPRLQTIALSSFQACHIHYICEVIEDRLALGTPITNVKIASMDHLDGFTLRSNLDWMRDNVCLQMQDKIQELPDELLIDSF